MENNFFNMKKSAIISILLFVILVNADSQIKELSHEGDYGKSIANMIELHLEQNPEQFEGAISFAAQVKKQLEADMASDDNHQLLQMASLDGDISLIENDLDVQSAQLKATNKFLSEVSAELVALIQTANSLTKQLNILNGKEEEIRENRSQEQLFFNKRIKNSNKVLGALRTILKTLTEAVLNPKNNVFTEQKADQLIDHLKQELGEKDPLISMVELTKDFDTNVVREIIHKLEFLEEDVEEVIKEDENTEKAAIVQRISIFNLIRKIIQRYYLKQVIFAEDGLLIYQV